MNLRKKIILGFICSLSFTTEGATFSDELTIQSIRTDYNGLIVRVTQVVNSDCKYPSTLMNYKDSVPNYQANVSLILSAWTQKKKIKVYYGGCGPDGSDTSQNVRVVGWVAEE